MLVLNRRIKLSDTIGVEAMQYLIKPAKDILDDLKFSSESGKLLPQITQPGTLNREIQTIALKVTGLSTHVSTHIGRYTYKALHSAAGNRNNDLVKKTMGHVRTNRMDAIYDSEYALDELLELNVELENYINEHIK